MFLNEITDFMEENVSPKCFHLFGQINGIQFGSKLKDRLIKRVLITIAPTLASLREAMKKKINLVISYYPLGAGPFYCIKENLAHKFALLSRFRLIFYVLNSGFEAAENGFIDILANKLHLMKEDVFSIVGTNDKEIPLGRICSPKNFNNQNEAFTLQDLLKRIENNLDAQSFRYVGEMTQEIEKVCIIEQVSRDLMFRAIEQGCQCYMTRDIGYKNAISGKELNMSLIEIAHYAETSVLNEFCNLISLEFPHVEFSYFNFKNPISFFKGGDFK